MNEAGLLSPRALLTLVALLAIVWFGTLDHRRLINPDEGRYAEIPREMVASGDWTTPRLNDIKYFYKPPLQYWATATAFAIFGEHHWTARLWPALTGFLGILFAGYAAARLYALRAGVIAAAILASSVLWNAIGHANTLDMGLSFFLAAAVLALCLAERGDGAASRRWRDGAWALLALATLSKGLIGLVLPAATVLAYMVWQRDWGLLLRLRPLRGLLILLAITAPWFVAVSLANPEFPRYFFIREHFERFLTKAHGRYQPAWYFIPILLVGTLPWLGSLFQGLWVGRRADGEHRFSANRMLLAWCAVVFVFFSASSSKLPSYILPIFPAVAILCAAWLAEREGCRRLAWEAVPAILAALAAGVLAYLAPRFANAEVGPELYAAYQPWLYAAAACLLGGALAAFVLGRRGRALGFALSLALGGHLFGQLFLLGHDEIGKVNSAHDAALAIRDRLPPGVPFFSAETYDQGLQFYLKRTTTMVAYRDELSFGIAQEPHKFIAMTADFEERWRDLPVAWALMSPLTWSEMQKKGLPMKVEFRDSRRVIVSKSPPPSPSTVGGGDGCSAAPGAASPISIGPGLGRPCAKATP
jgi:4-amino-4-deoxy-L-arabinose transferase-like glycosyltransferase